MEVYSKDDVKNLSGYEFSENSQVFESSDSDHSQMAMSDEESDSEVGDEEVVKKKSSNAIQSEKSGDVEDVFLTQFSADFNQPILERLEANVMELSPYRLLPLANWHSLQDNTTL